MNSPSPLVEIVSSSTPCGVTYLLNILLELNIKIFAGSEKLFWSKKGDTFLPNPLLQKKFSLWIPSLAKSGFQFANEEPVVAWTHDWAYSQPSGVKRIIFIRDPRDAHFSDHKRKHVKQPLLEYMNEATLPLGADRISKFTLLYNLWLCLSEPDDSTMILRFEDIKANPVHWVEKTLAFLEVARPADQIQNAILASATDSVKKKFEEQMKHAGISTGTDEVIRKGLPFEWKNDPTRKDILLYNQAYFAEFLTRFGYDSFTAEKTSEPTGSIEKAERAIANIYGKGDRWLHDRHRQIAERTIAEFYQAVPLDEPARAWPLQMPFLLQRSVRMGIFVFGIWTLTKVANTLGKVSPAIRRAINRKIMSYPLGEK